MSPSLRALTTTGPITDAARLGTVLGIWAHPDDEAFLSAGLMAAARDAGSRVVCVTATLGEHGTDDPSAGHPSGWRGPRARAARLAGRARRHRAPPAGPHRRHLRRRSRATPVVARLAEIIDAVAPDTIVTFGPDGMTGHEDHQTVSAWATAAHAAAAPDARLLYATTTEEFVQALGALPASEFNMFLADGLPLRTPAVELAVAAAARPATPSTARSSRCGRRPARPRPVRGAGRGAGAASGGRPRPSSAARPAAPARRAGAPGGWRHDRHHVRPCREKSAGRRGLVSCVGNSPTKSCE